VLGSLIAPAASAAASPAPVNVAAKRAVRYARAHGVKAAVAVLDLKTGKFYGAGNYNSVYGSASVAKLFVATKLLLTGQMHGSIARTAYKMITRSDDDAMNALLPLAGGPSVIN